MGKHESNLINTYFEIYGAFYSKNVYMCIKLQTYISVNNVHSVLVKYWFKLSFNHRLDILNLYHFVNVTILTKTRTNINIFKYVGTEE